MKRRLRFLALYVLPLFMPACTDSRGGGTWAGTTETLPNGAVRVRNPAAALWGPQNAWQLEAELVLGQVEGDGADVFASISGLQADAAGRIYVLDRQTNELRIFDAAGRHVRSVGRAGEGPGEYSAANGLLWMSEDTLLVVDQRGGRYTILSSEGDYVRSVRRRLGFYAWAFDGGMDGDRVYEVSTVGQSETPQLALLGTRVRGAEVEGGIAMTEQEVETGPRFIADTIMLPSPDGPLYEAFSVRTPRQGMVISVPFSGAPVHYLDGKSGVWYGHGRNPAVYHATVRGDTLAEILLGTEPVPVSPDEVTEWLAQPSIEQFRTLGGKLDADRIPRTKPYFDRITSDAEGNLWLTVPAGPQQVLFAILDPEGRYLGQLKVDGVRRDAYLSPLVRNDRLYFVGRDELDVQRVYVYRVNKS